MNESSRIQELMAEVEIYKKALQDVKDALAAAETELDETLETGYESEKLQTLTAAERE